MVRFGPLADLLREADRRGLDYQLVHVGTDDGEEEGSHARAHHRVSEADLPGLARRLRSRARQLVEIVAFGFKHGLPADAAFVFDARFLDNPYWVPELRPLTGHDAAVQDFVLAQAGAGPFIDMVAALLDRLLPALRERGRHQVTVAIGCTGGRHRSVVLAKELARRLSQEPAREVTVRARDL